MEKERKEIQTLEALTRAAAINHIESNPNWFEELPPGERSKLIMPHIPRAKPTEQEIEAEYLSVASALGDVPDVRNISQEMYVLRAALTKAKAEITDLKAKIKKISRKYPTHEDIFRIMQKREDHIRRFYTQRSSSFMPMEEFCKAIREVYKETTWRQEQDKTSTKSSTNSPTTSSVGAKTPSLTSSSAAEPTPLDTP